jgi:hypothetical protein
MWQGRATITTLTPAHLHGKAFKIPAAAYRRSEPGFISDGRAWIALKPVVLVTQAAAGTDIFVGVRIHPPHLLQLIVR